MPVSSTISNTERVVSFDQARHVVEAEANALLNQRRGKIKIDSVPLARSRGRVLAEELRSDRDLPPFNRAARDGYAVRAADIQAASEANPAVLRVVGEIAAGAEEASEIRSGEAIEIMTGAPAPESADAVVMVEHTKEIDGSHVQVFRSVKPGENVARRGSEARQGAVLLPGGERMTPASIAVAASIGCAEVPVYARPRVSILATGNELVDVAKKPAAHQIRNSNSHSIAAQVEAAGGEPVLLPTAPDEGTRLTELVREGFRTDLLLLAGGVSMGKYDLVKEVLASFNAEFFFTGARIQPGKPLVFGRINMSNSEPKYFFGLPGNPVSTQVTFDLFVKPIIHALAGAAPSELYFVQARLKNEIRVKTGLTRFLPGRLCEGREKTEVEPVRWQGSADVVAAAQANCYIVVPPECDVISAGEMVSLLMHT